MELVFSTHDLPEKDGFSYFCDEFTQKFDYHFVMEKDKGEFFVEVWADNLGDAVLSQWGGCPYKIWRSQYEIGQASKHYIMVCKMLEGGVSIPASSGEHNNPARGFDIG